jgi:hypothetical protein
MSNVLMDLHGLCKSCLKLKTSIYENEIIFNATDDQEDAFYRMVEGLVNKTEKYMDTYKGSKHVIDTKAFIENHKEMLENGFRVFDFNEMKSQLEKLYNERQPNELVFQVESIVFWPIRVIVECLHRQLNEVGFDKMLDTLFETIDQDFEESVEEENQEIEVEGVETSIEEFFEVVRDKE